MFLDRILSCLKEAEILNSKNQDAVKSHAEHFILAQMVYFLHKNRLLNQVNFDLVMGSTCPSDLSVALCDLNELGILTQNHFALLASYPAPHILAKAFCILQEAGILTEENIGFILIHAKLAELTDALYAASEGNIINQLFTSLVTHKNPCDIIHVLSILGKQFLTPENLNAVAVYPHLEQLSEAISDLDDKEILTQDNLHVLFNHESPYDLASALCILQEERLLTHEHRDAVALHAKPQDLATAFCFLQEHQLLTPEHKALVRLNKNPSDLACALIVLHKAGISTPENRNLILCHEHSEDLTLALCCLKDARLLNQANFNALLSTNHVALIGLEASEIVWFRIPDHLLTQVNFERLMIASEHENPLQELERVTHEILANQFATIQALNPAQSTHTASVHRSVSDSAHQLMQSYAKDLNFEQTIEDIKTYVNQLEDKDVAKRCIERITRYNFSYTDSSGVSMRQLLALVWAAIHDSKKCISSLEDSRALLVEALYEIQRGYNINDEGIDDRGVDKPICIAGTFNKLIEKLNGIHEDVQVFYITKAGATLKFSKLAEKEALAYLESLSSPETLEQYQAVKELLSEIETNGSLAPIWHQIRDKVKTKLWDEFQEAFANHSSHTDFLSLLDNGQYLPAVDISDIQKRIRASLGYQAHHNQFGFSQHHFWSSRHSSNKAQMDFDKQYGLIIRQ